jgi:hypothetical protein
MQRTGTRVAILLVVFAAGLWVLFTVNRVPTAPDMFSPADSIVLESPGYLVTAHRSGLMRVRFLLHDLPSSPDDIATQWTAYPEEREWDHVLSPDETEQLFALANHRRFNGVEREYLAPPGAATSRDAAIVYRLTTFERGEVRKQVTFDDSRRVEWPVPLAALVGALLQAAPPPGRELPLRLVLE